MTDTVYKQSTITGIIVKFTDIHTGTVVANPTHNNPIGKYSTSWVEATDKVWTDTDYCEVKLTF